MAGWLCRRVTVGLQLVLVLGRLCFAQFSHQSDAPLRFDALPPSWMDDGDALRTTCSTSGTVCESFDTLDCSGAANSVGVASGMAFVSLWKPSTFTRRLSMDHQADAVRVAEVWSAKKSFVTAEATP